MVRLNDDKDVKLTVSGDEFQTSMIRSTKKICRTLQEHCGLYSSYLCPRVVQTVLSVKKLLRLTDTIPNMLKAFRFCCCSFSF